MEDIDGKLRARYRELADLERALIMLKKCRVRSPYVDRLGSAIIAAIGYHIRFRADRRLLRRSPLFDATWYVSRYADGPAAIRDPVGDYLLRGASLGRDPGPDFDTVWYLMKHTDVRIDLINPLVHYIRYGAEEKRAIHPAYIDQPSM